MKYNVLAAIVAGALLSACGGGGSDDADSYTAKAYDPAIKGMEFSYKCNDENVYTVSGITDINGNGITSNATVINTPQNCEFKFYGIPGSIDVDNSKSMEGVTYYIPKGMAKKGQLVTASAISTYIYKDLEGGEYIADDYDSIQLLIDLGLEGLDNEGVDFSKLLLDPESVVKGLSPENKALLLRTTTILTDLLKAETGNTLSGNFLTDVSDIKSLLDTYIDYPFDSEGKLLQLKLTKVGGVYSIESSPGTKYVAPDPTGTGTGTGSTSGGN